ncbi:MAG: hypothetical protein AMK72_03775 [Planctomycetes bacterium SM23_25]|nr:MAG: hypothetical protein AMK72_03775 [Planctomycetes bacterium SM23_25]
MEARRRLGVVLREQGLFRDAETCLREVLKADPGDLAALYELAVTLWEQERLAEATEILTAVARKSPRTLAVWRNLGILLERQGQRAQAIDAYRHAAELAPDRPELHEKLGDLVSDAGQEEQALDWYRRAAAVGPGHAGIEAKLGRVLHNLGRLTEAAEQFEGVIRRMPQAGAGHGGLGNVRAAQGRLDEALACYERALAVEPANAQAQHNLLFCLNHQANLDPQDLFRRHREWGQAVEREANPAIHQRTDAMDRRLRIGYVSADFRRHAVAFFLEAVFAQRDRARFKVYCYSDVSRPDNMTRRFEAMSDEWLSAVGWSDEDLAKRIRQDRTDILVDLAGHTAGNRLRVFARKPAPIQVTWLGYPNTTGLTRVDYRITDAWADPPGTTESLHTEELVRLSGGSLCYVPPEDAPPVAPPPCGQSGLITFGSFNKHAKVTDITLALWADVLRDLPHSRLLLKSNAMADGATRSAMWDRLVRLGVYRDRVELRPATRGFVEHLATYSHVDIALDTVPYTGTTTTCEALWMGVPVVTLAGRTHVGRVGVSLLQSAGVPSWIARTPSEFTRIAVDLASDPDRLAGLRSAMRERLSASRLLDAEGFAQRWEQACLDMWQRRCAERE